LKKADMATEAARLLFGTGWLPEPLRLAELESAADAPKGEAETLPDFLSREEDGVTAVDPDELETNAIAAD